MTIPDTNTISPKHIRLSFIILGIVSILSSILGLLYNLLFSAWGNHLGAFDILVKEKHLTYFFQAFYIMSGICLICYILLMICGIYFIRQKDRFVSMFVGVLLFEMLYFICLGFINDRLDEPYSVSIAAATGVANGGLMYQFFILFPIWGSALAIWMKRKRNRKLYQANVN